MLTGTLATLSREEAKTQIRAHGGTVVGTVSKKTDYVVVGENPGSKKTEAEKMGVTLLDEEAFQKLLGFS